MTAGPDGNVWFADTYNSLIGRITPDGAITEFGVGEVVRPGDLQVGPDGNLWFLDGYSPSVVVRKMSTGGQLLGSYPVAPLGSFELVIGPDGNFWVAGVSSVNRVTLNGAVTSFPVPPEASGTVRNLTVGPDGAIWFSVNGLAVLGRATITGVVTTDISFELIGEPVGMGAGPDGNMWVTDQYDRIHRVTPDGAITSFQGNDVNSTISNRLTFLPTNDRQGLWFAGGDGIARVQVMPDDQISFTPRFSGAQCTIMRQVSDSYGGRSMSSWISSGVEIMAQLAEQGRATDLDPPINNGPCPIPVTFPRSELPRLEAAASAWGISTDELVHDGGQILLAIIYYLAVTGGR
jgi:virginiamycin B lyase